MPLYSLNYLQILAQITTEAGGFGSGFMVRMPSSSPTATAIALVTNRHVVSDGSKTHIKLNQRGQSTSLEFPSDGWMRSSDDDLAVIVLGIVDLSACAYYHVCLSSFAKQEGIYDPFVRRIIGKKDAFDDPYASAVHGSRAFSKIGLGSDVFMVSMFSEYRESAERIRPVIRFGNISMMPGDIPMELGTPQEFTQEGFFVEMRSIPGTSGSPVFVRDQSVDGTMPVSIGMHWTVPDEPQLLGIECGNYEPVGKSRSIDKTMAELAEKMMITANAGLTVVIPAWRVARFLDLSLNSDLKTSIDRAIEAVSRSPRTRRFA